MSVAFERNELWPHAQAGMQLAATDVDRVDSAGAAREQDLAEAAGGSADVEANAPRGLEPKVIERERELHPAARHIRVRRLGAQDGVGGDLVRGLDHQDLVRRHTAGGDGGLRLGTAFEQAALDEQAIDASARDHAGCRKYEQRCARPASPASPKSARWNK